MLSADGKKWIEEGFETALKSMGNMREAIQANLSSCPEDVAWILKFYYSSMPYSDFTDTDFSVLKAYAEHALFIRENIPWCRTIPERIFLMDVAAYRINNEKIHDCRRFFYDQLWPRIQNMTMEEAILEANYWCCENATYHLCDSRTASALTVYRSGWGRCGEESVFGVTVLRSVGIPCRQVYTSRWAHCDDNHAWVEVWHDGRWSFLGACEPEEVLNKGWFTHPASRAMMIHTKYFTCLPVEEGEFTDGFVHYINRTSLYAHTKQVTVRILDTDRQPLSGVHAELQVLNAAEYYPFFIKDTDATGEVRVETGLGSVRFFMSKDGKSSSIDFNTADIQDRLDVIFTGEEDTTPWREYHLFAPDGANIHPGLVTAEQKERNQTRLTQAAALRTGRISSYYKEEMGEKHPQVKELLMSAGENVGELCRFLERDDNPLRPAMLQVLTSKDMYDVDADILEAHLQHSLTYKDTVPENIFIRFLMNPRISFEELTDYRGFICDYFSEEEKELFRRNPRYIWKYIEDHISNEELRDYKTLRISPAGALTLGLTNEPGRAILFAAICRSLGIPARINPMDRDVEYYQNGEFHAISVQYREYVPSSVTLTFTMEEGTPWHYHEHWSLAQYQQGRWETLRLFKKPENNTLTFRTKPGFYRVLITTRTPHGNQLVREGRFFVTEGQDLTVELKKSSLPPMDCTMRRDLPVFSLQQDTEKRTVSTNDLQNGRYMYLWLEAGKEPTEHVLNEMLEQAELCRTLHDRILLILPGGDRNMATLEALLEKVPELTCYTPSSPDTLEQLCNTLDLRQGDLPLVYVTDAGQAIYADCGYNVGSVNLMFKLMQGENL